MRDTMDMVSETRTNAVGLLADTYTLGAGLDSELDVYSKRSSPLMPDTHGLVVERNDAVCDDGAIWWDRKGVDSIRFATSV